MRLNQVQREFDLFYLRNDSQQKFALGNEMIELIDYVDELDCQVIGLPLQAHQDKCYECDYDAPSLERNSPGYPSPSFCGGYVLKEHSSN